MQNHTNLQIKIYWSPRFKGCQRYHLKIPLYPCSIKAKNLQTMLLVLNISFSPEKGQLDLFPSFMGPQDLLDVGSPQSVCWFLPVEVSGIALW
jgi:hypothetical protein